MRHLQRVPYRSLEFANLLPVYLLGQVKTDDSPYQPLNHGQGHRQQYVIERHSKEMQDVGFRGRRAPTY